MEDQKTQKKILELLSEVNIPLTEDDIEAGLLCKNLIRVTEILHEAIQEGKASAKKDGEHIVYFTDGGIGLDICKEDIEKARQNYQEWILQVRKKYSSM